jgi:lysyl-tRNA synthetase class 2
MSEKSEQEVIRRDKLKKLREKNGYPFPNDVKITSNALTTKADALALNTEAHQKGDSRIIAGRIMMIRLMGKAAFFNLQDRTEVIQVYIKRDDVGVECYEKFVSFDIGDIVEVKGYPFITKTGEPSLHAEGIRLLVKCLHPLPEKWHGLTDIEVRYRQRYLDLIVNPEVRDTFIKRSKIIAAIRRFFDARGYYEVETPVTATVASGAAARPFVTHHNALNLDLHLRIALELPLKKLMVGGLERVYEIGRIFRNEGISREHNPEFTMIEFYQAYATYEDLMTLTEELVVGLCDEVVGSREIQFGEAHVNYNSPWKRVSMVDSIHEIGGVSKEYDLLTLSGAQQAAKSLGFDDLVKLDNYGLIIYEIFDRYVESKIVNPTFITRHPTAVSPLSRPSMDDARFVDRFELFVAGLEVANAFSELNDVEDQVERFIEQRESKAKGNDEAMEMDDDFIRALEYGMPPTAGQGIGIDRLVMLLTGSPSIRDVILFPVMRPE